MSTRTNILLAAEDDAVYQYYIHYDGYPEGVGCQLVEWLAHAYLSRNDYRLEKWAAYAKGLPASPEPTLQRVILDELRTHNRDGENAGPGDLLEPEDTYDVDERNDLHGDIEYLYVIDTRDPNAARLLCLNVRSYDWKRVYLESRQSYRAILSAALQNGTEMARFSYPKHFS